MWRLARGHVPDATTEGPVHHEAHSECPLRPAPADTFSQGCRMKVSAGPCTQERLLSRDQQTASVGARTKANGPWRFKNWGATITLFLVVAVAASAGLARASIVSPSTSDRGPVLASSPGQTLTFTVGDRVQIADVTREGLSTKDVSLRLFPGHMQGVVGVESVDFRFEPKRLEGRSETVGSRWMCGAHRMACRSRGPSASDRSRWRCA